MDRQPHRLRAFLRSHRRWYLLASSLNRLVPWASAVVLLFVVLGVVFALFPWILLPALAAGAVTVFILSAFAYLFYRILLRPPTLESVARLVEDKSNRPHPLLSIALQLSGEKAAHGSSELIARTREQADKELCEYPSRLPGLVRRGRMAILGLSLLGATAVIPLLQPSLLQYIDAPLTLLRPIQLRIEPGSHRLPMHASVDLRCTPRQGGFPSARLQITDLATERTRRHLLRGDSAGVFSFLLDSLTTSVAYRFSVGNASSRPETLTVVSPPALYSLQLSVKPPAYTRLPSVALREGQGSVAAYAGSRVSFRIQSQNPLQRAWYVPDPGDTVPLTIEDSAAEGEVRLWRDHRYSFVLEDSLDQRNDSLPSFYVDIMKDHHPRIRILRPAASRALTPEQQETLWVEGADDLGIRRMTLHWRRAPESLDSVGKYDLLPKRTVGTVLRQEFVWDLTELSLYPGDTVYYWARVRDTKPFGTPQVAVSDTFWFRVPSMAEIHRQIARKHDMAEEAMEATRERNRTLEDKLEEFVRSAEKSRSELSWEQKQIVKDLSEGLKAQEDSLARAMHELQEAVRQMKEEGVLTEELAGKMDEVREALSELMKEYGDSLFFEPPDPNDQVRWQDIRQAMEKMQKMLPELSQRLDQALQFLEAVKKDQRLASLAAKAEKMADRQLQMRQSEDPRRREHQRSLTGEIKNFGNELREFVEESASDQVEMPQSMDQVGESLREMLQAMENNAMPSDAAMSRMSGSLQSTAQELRSMLSTAMMAQMMKERDMLLEMASDALGLAGWQQELMEQNAERMERRMAAVTQQGIRDALRRNLQKLDSLQATPPQALQGIMQQSQDAMISMQEALTMMGEGGRSEGPMQQAATGLDRLAQSFMESADAMQQAGGSSGGGGLMAGMRKLSGRQAAVNSATADLLRQLLQGGQKGGGQQGGGQPRGGRGEGMSRGEAAAAREAARKAQRQIAEELERLAEEYGKGEGGAGKRLKELEEEARRLARMLENPTEEVAERQDRFLVRMLQSSLSVHRREEGKEERKSKAARTIYSSRQPGDPGVFFKDTDTFYNLRSKALEGNYPRRYRTAVQEYFDSLGTLYLRGSHLDRR